MGPSGLDHMHVFVFKGSQGFGHLFCSWQKLFFYSYDCGYAHGCGEGVVGALGTVHIIIWMEQLLSSQLISPVGDYLIYIHV